jgi:serine-type D-Ala-D-Ala carboxypeptidase
VSAPIRRAQRRWWRQSPHRCVCALLTVCAAWFSPRDGQAQRAAGGSVAARTARVADSVGAVLQRAMRDSAFPGAIAVIGNGRGTLTSQAVGVLDVRDSTVPGTRTIYDLASLTKIVATTTIMMQLVDQGRVQLNAPVVRYLPTWRGPGVASVTIRQLLTHSSGLAAWRPFYKEAVDRADATAQLMLIGPEVPPDTRYLYSDMNFMLLGLVIEAVTMQPLEDAFQTRVARPLRMVDTRFRPDSLVRARVAPTEFDPWRGRQLRGEVHDENASRFDGVSGHAGLFATADDLTSFARLWLNGGTLAGTRLASPRTVTQFSRVFDRRFSQRALGWETPNGSNSAGKRLSPRAFGHTGFTGTSLWIDPSRDLFILLLTNRVNPTRENRRIGAVRTALADAVVGALDGVAPPSRSTSP